MEKETIEWGWGKILVTLLVFIVTIGIVFISVAPVLGANLSRDDVLVLVVGVCNLLRLLEFVFVTSAAHLAVWNVSTGTMNLLSFFVINPAEFEKILDALGGEKSADAQGS